MGRSDLQDEIEKHGTHGVGVSTALSVFLDFSFY